MNRLDFSMHLICKSEMTDFYALYKAEAGNLLYQVKTMYNEDITVLLTHEERIAIEKLIREDMGDAV